MSDRENIESDNVGVPPAASTALAGGWLAPLLVAGITIAWVLLIYCLVGDRPATWQYGTAPYIPATSIFSSEQPPAGKVPNQVTLPQMLEDQPNAHK